MADPQTENTGYSYILPKVGNDDVNEAIYTISQMMATLDTMKLVKVIEVHGGGSSVAAGTVDVQPLVSQIDSQGNTQEHGVVYGIPWVRVQGGKNAIVCDPKKDDIGFVVCADRDISSVKANSGAISAPGSFRKYNISDGVYIGAVLMDAPEQYIEFTATGLKIVDKNGNIILTGTGGTTITDSNGNVINMSAAGMNLTDKNANQIIMAAGFVNIVTPVLQHNGTPIPP